MSLGTNTEYRNAYKETLDQPEEPVTPAPEVDPVTGEPLPTEQPTKPEEVTWSKRYGDLRRYIQQKEGGYKKNIEALQAQVDQLTRQNVQLPKTEEEIAAWVEQYPDVAKIVESIAMKKVMELRADVDKGFEEVKTLRKQTAKEKAEAELLRLHPDFDEIRNDPLFHVWAENQPDWVQKALYQNEDDARSAGRAVDLYKLDKAAADKAGKRGPGRPRKEPGAAEEVPSGHRGTPTSDDGIKRIKESEVAKMTPREYEAKEDEIMAARREGRFVYDLSGRAM